MYPLVEPVPAIVDSWRLPAFLGSGCLPLVPLTIDRVSSSLVISKDLKFTSEPSKRPSSKCVCPLSPQLGMPVFKIGDRLEPSRGGEVELYLSSRLWHNHIWSPFAIQATLSKERQDPTARLPDQTWRQHLSTLTPV